MPTETTVVDQPSLHDRWQALKEQSPGVRARDAADRLGVSEAELVASRPIPSTRRLDLSGRDLIHAVKTLGPVMALTRNSWAVHEKTGVYDKIAGGEKIGLVLNEAIDLRMFYEHWVHVYACEEQVRSGLRRSLQVFDGEGVAVHKIYLTGDSDTAAFERLVARTQTENLPPSIARIAPPTVSAATDVDAFEPAWRAMTDTHQFHGLLKSHGLARTRAFRMVGDDLARRVANRTVVDVLEGAAKTGLPIMVFVGNRGCIQIHSGPVQRLLATGPWFNVLDPGFNLHLRLDGIAESWVVRKPTTDGIVTSLELLDAEGGVIAYLFGARRPGDAERTGWRDLIASVESDAHAS